MGRPHFYRLTGTALMLAILATGAGAAGKQEYKFTNNTEREATDLHVEFDGNVTWTGSLPPQTPPGTFSGVNGKGTKKINLSKSQTGLGVPVGGSLVISLDFTDDAEPKVTKAYWTKSNTLTPDEAVDTLRGPNFDPLLKEDPEQRNVWVMAPATGDGLVSVVIDGVPHNFSPLPGDDGVETAERFAIFLDATQFGYGKTTGKASCYSGSHRRDGPDSQVLILQQDSTQPMTTGVDPVPGSSPAMLLATALAMMAAAGLWMVWRGRRVASQ